MGIHAPGGADRTTELQVSHHLNLAFSTATRALRETVLGALVGTGTNIAQHYPMTDTPADIAVAERRAEELNWWILGPIINGFYPEAV